MLIAYENMLDKRINSSFYHYNLLKIKRGDQMNEFNSEVITNLGVYDLFESVVASGYAMASEYNLDNVNNALSELEYRYLEDDEDICLSSHTNRAFRLMKNPLNSGHCSFAKGIVVNMDLTFTNKAWIEFQRYHFADIVTGMSTMHRISKFDLSNAFNEFTDPQIIDRLQELQEKYNEDRSPDNYLRLLYSTPSGLKMTGRVTTNYLQLMNIWQQRHNHRLPEWRKFCMELQDKLPFFEDFLKNNGLLK